MICVYPAEATDFSNNGNGVLAPLSAQVTETLNGEYELQVSHPIDDEGKWQRLVEGCILRAPVPAAMTPKLSSSIVSGTVTNTVAVYKASKQKILHVGPSLDRQIIGCYKTDDEFIVLSQPSNQWYEVTAPDGKHGYIDTTGMSKVKDTTTEQAVEEVVEPRQLRDQPFRIYRVVPELDKVTAYARHISYDLMDNMIQTYKPAATDTGAAVVQGISSHCLSEHPFTFYSDLDSTAEEVEFTNVNPLDAIMGDEGLIAKYGGELTRDWFDVYVVRRVGVDSNVQIRQAKNLLGISYDVDLSDVTTRIMPTGQDKNGKVLYLPELFIDSPLIDLYPHPKWIHMEVSEAKEVTSSDEQKTKAQCYTEMRDAAQAQFDAGCDLPKVTLNVDFINCADTEEYREYGLLQNIYLGDAVRVIAPRIGVSVSMRMTQYTYDCLTREYTQMTLGTVADTVQSNMISARQLPTGIISGSKLAIDSVGSGALQDGSVGSLQVQTAAIQSAHIDQAAIGYAHIGQAAIDRLSADAVEAVSIHVQELAAGTISADDFYAALATIAVAEVKRAKIEAADIRWATIGTADISAANISWAQIVSLAADIASIAQAQIASASISEAQVDNLTSRYAHITNGVIDNASINWANIANLDAGFLSALEAKIQTAAITTLIVNQINAGSARITNLDTSSAHIGWANIDGLTAGSALITQGVGGKLYITDLAVSEANIVSLTAGQLLVKDSQGKFRRIYIDAQGTVTTEVVNVGDDNIVDGTLHADKLVEHSITADQLNVASILADNALIGAVTTRNLDAEAVTASKIKAGTITTHEVASNFGEALNLSSNESIHSVVRDAKTDVLNTADERYASAGDVDELSGTVQDLSSEIEQTKEDITIKFNAAEAYTDASVKGANDYITQAQAYFRFSADGLEIGVLGSEFTSRFTNSRLSFLQNGQEIAYVSNNKLYITDAEAKKFSAGTSANGYLDFVSVADGVGFVWRN